MMRRVVKYLRRLDKEIDSPDAIDIAALLIGACIGLAAKEGDDMRKLSEQIGKRIFAYALSFRDLKEDNK